MTFVLFTLVSKSKRANNASEFRTISLQDFKKCTESTKKSFSNQTFSIILQKIIRLFEIKKKLFGPRPELFLKVNFLTFCDLPEKKCTVHLLRNAYLHTFVFYYLDSYILYRSIYRIRFCMYNVHTYKKLVKSKYLLLWSNHFLPLQRIYFEFWILLIG